MNIQAQTAEEEILAAAKEAEGVDETQEEQEPLQNAGEHEEAQEQEAQDQEHQGEAESRQLTIEEQAKAMGWSPKEEWKGAEGKHIDAKRYVERGLNRLPLLQSNITKLMEKNSDLEKSMQILVKRTQDQDKSDFDRSMEGLKRQRAEAVDNADGAALNRIEEQIDALREKDKARSVDFEPKKASDPAQEPDYVAWASENSWYGSDEALTVSADGQAAAVRAENPSLSGRPFFDEVSRRVKALHADKFENTRRSNPSAVEGSTERAPSGKKTYASLPPEAKKACDDFVASGIITKADYVKEYFAQ